MNEKKIIDYIKSIFPVQDKTNFEALLKIIADIFDHLKEENYKAREPFFVHSAKMDDLLIYAKERGITIFPFDTEETIKDKIYFANQVLKEQSIKSVLKKVISFYYEEQFDLYDYFEISDTNEYSFFLRVYKQLSNEERTLLENVINSYKPAHCLWFIEETVLDEYLELDTGSLDINILN